MTTCCVDNCINDAYVLGKCKYHYYKEYSKKYYIKNRNKIIEYSKKHRLDNSNTKGISGSLKGKTYEEIYGKERGEKQKEAIKKALMGHKISEETKKKISLTEKRSTRIYKHKTKYFYNNIYFRSNWEISFVKWCEKENLKYEYEPKRFNLGEINYIPDFYLPDWNFWVEVKGYWDEKSKLKCMSFKEKISNRLWVIDGYNYNFLDKKWKNIEKEITSYDYHIEEYLCGVDDAR